MLALRALTGQGRRAITELLLPPVGLAAVELGLHLADVGREVVLLLRQPPLELVDGDLAPLELLEPELDVGLGARLARLDVGLALVEIADASREFLLLLVQTLLEPLEARAL